jgi:hypothetical protein
MLPARPIKTEPCPLSRWLLSGCSILAYDNNMASKDNYDEKDHTELHDAYALYRLSVSVDIANLTQWLR